MHWPVKDRRSKDSGVNNGTTFCNDRDRHPGALFSSERCMTTGPPPWTYNVRIGCHGGWNSLLALGQAVREDSPLCPRMRPSLLDAGAIARLGRIRRRECSGVRTSLWLRRLLHLAGDDWQFQVLALGVWFWAQWRDAT